MTLRSLLCLVYGTGICVGRAARNSCIILIQFDESRVLRAHGNKQIVLEHCVSIIILQLVPMTRIRTYTFFFSTFN